MRVGIMQPYFFPYLGYISLIKNTNRFILLDEVQFIRHGWIERNRVLKQNADWLYIKVPLLKNGRETLIKDCLINNNINWQEKILAQLSIYKKIAPFYKDTIEIVNELFSRKFNKITELNKDALLLICDYLSIQADIQIFSEMDIQIKKPEKADEWALNICKELGNVNEYWNPIGGIDFFDRSFYAKESIKLIFHKIRIVPYNQKREEFIPGLSILDAMMFNPPEEINKMLNNFDIL